MMRFDTVKPRSAARTSSGKGSRDGTIISATIKTGRLPARSISRTSNKTADEDDKERTSSSAMNRRRLNVGLAALLTVAVLHVISLYGQSPTVSRQHPLFGTERADTTDANPPIKTRRDQQVVAPPKNASNMMESSLHPTLAPAKKLKVPYPIFVASFSKSGTTSTFYAFSCYLGFDYVAHRWTTSARKDGKPEMIGRCMEYNIDHSQPPLEGCGVNHYNQTQTVVWSDTAYIGGPRGCYHPNLDALEAFWQAYPHATLLLVRRNATAWFRSANSQRAAFIHKWAQKCPQMPHTNSESEWVDFYNNYTQRVRQFAAQRQGQMTYVEVELESPDTGKILQDQMGLPQSCWKHCLSSFTMQECTDLQHHQQQQQPQQLTNQK